MTNIKAVAVATEGEPWETRTLPHSQQIVYLFLKDEPLFLTRREEIASLPRGRGRVLPELCR